MISPLITRWVAICCAIATLLGLLVVLPYFEGYGDERKTIFFWFLNSWVAYAGEWKHCVFVPLLVGYLVYQQRLSLSTLPSQGHWIGLLVYLVALFLYFIGYLSGNNYFGYISTHLLYAGLILYFFGCTIFWKLLFPQFFLIFMWPLGFLDNLLAFPLRILMSTASHHFLNLLGFTNLQIGTAIVSAPDFANNVAQGARFALDVADPCSGIRSLFAMLMISSLYGYLAFSGHPSVVCSSSSIENPKSKSHNLPAWFLMLLVFLSAIPLVILGNMARILLLAFGTIIWGVEFAVGTIDRPTWFHEGAGFLVYAVELVGLWGVVTLLEKVSSRRKPIESAMTGS